MIRWLLAAPLLILVVLFALSNRHPVEVRLWPFDVAWVAPLAVAVLIVAALAFLLGAVVVWAAGLPQRRRARKMAEAAKLMEAELAEIRAREKAEAAARLAGTHEPAPAPAGAPRLT